MTNRKKGKKKRTYRPKHTRNVWVKTRKRGILVVERCGFVEVPVLDAPNEMHIDAFFRWVNLLANRLGVKVPNNPEKYE